MSQKLSHLKKVFTRPPCLCLWLNQAELDLIRDLRTSLSKTFGGPGSKGPSEVLGRELLDQVKVSFRALFHPTVALVMSAVCDHLLGGSAYGGPQFFGHFVRPMPSCLFSTVGLISNPLENYDFGVSCELKSVGSCRGKQTTKPRAALPRKTQSKPPKKQRF